ncbi:MAG: putative adenosine/AMP deaminase [Pseudonocardiales bacterium]|nr:putative adenosine/AMP deaminase [Pseudonocardiales bacterium]
MIGAPIPKAELHLHIEGTLEPELAFALAERNGVTLPYPNVAALSNAYEFKDLSSFLALYYQCMNVLQTARDFHDLTRAYLIRAEPDGVRHAEIFFDPQAHLTRGVALAEVMAGLTSATTTHRGVTASLIACFMRDLGPTAAMQTLEQLAPYVGQGPGQIIGVGLDSAEVGHPPAAFRDVFEAASGLGLRLVAHAGEEGPPDYIWQAIDVLGVERVDHGIRAVEDVALMRRLARDAIPLTVCPLSNVKLGCVPTLSAHPLPTLLEHGVLVTLNSDDPAYFGGYIGANYDAVAAESALNGGDLRTFAANSFIASFLDADESAYEIRGTG